MMKDSIEERQVSCNYSYDDCGIEIVLRMLQLVTSCNRVNESFLFRNTYED